jgi:membrane protein implicated in regulation of membrane protease activity
VEKTQPIDVQIQRLEESKYDTRWEAMKGFADAALPTLITFGVGAALVATLAVGGAAILGWMGIGTGAAALTGAASIPATIATAGFGIGGTAATISGSLHAATTAKVTSEKNKAIDHAIQIAKEEANKQGVTIPEPVIERDNPAKNSNLVQNILKQGENKFHPARIAERGVSEVQQLMQR